MSVGEKPAATGKSLATVREHKDKYEEGRGILAQEGRQSPLEAFVTNKTNTALSQSNWKTRIRSRKK